MFFTTAMAVENYHFGLFMVVCIFPASFKSYISVLFLWWQLAQKDLQKINMYKAPRDKLVCILNCCKVIGNLLLNASVASRENPPGADEFLPVLIYVTIKVISVSHNRHIRHSSIESWFYKMLLLLPTVYEKSWVRNLGRLVALLFAFKVFGLMNCSMLPSSMTFSFEIFCYQSCSFHFLLELEFSRQVRPKTVRAFIYRCIY